MPFERALALPIGSHVARVASEVQLSGAWAPHVSHDRDQAGFPTGR
jgi:hypothetical protein